MVSWGQIVEYSELFTNGSGDGASGGEGEGGGDSEITHRVNGLLRVVVWDAETRQRKVVPMRWGFPHPRDWRRPQPIHARAENIRRGIEQEALAVPASAEAKCPAHCLDNSPPCAGRDSISDSLRKWTQAEGKMDKAKGEVHRAVGDVKDSLKR
jgi:hypothetical protein